MSATKEAQTKRALATYGYLLLKAEDSPGRYRVEDLRDGNSKVCFGGEPCPLTDIDAWLDQLPARVAYRKQMVAAGAA